jgi:hypothetical protein
MWFSTRSNHQLDLTHYNVSRGAVGELCLHGSETIPRQ